jgi:hypothetical protein
MDYYVPRRLWNVPPGTYTVTADELYNPVCNPNDCHCDEKNIHETGAKDMRDYEALERQAARLLEHAEKARAERERFGEDDYPDQAVITFDKTFPGGTRVYHYAAMKTIHLEDQYGNNQEPYGLWYTTGPKSPKGYTWDELVNWMGPGVQEIYYVTGLEKVVG